MNFLHKLLKRKKIETVSGVETMIRYYDDGELTFGRSLSSELHITCGSSNEVTKARIVTSRSDPQTNYSNKGLYTILTATVICP